MGVGLRSSAKPLERPRHLARRAEGFLDGRYQDTAEIAQRFKLSDAHVCRLLRLGYLAP
jgi:hypothetical protein